ncbi:MAG: flp pilus-assembly TadE/G-like family protein [Chloroflexota bacterium]|nr:flp pilus-assembly TadE/G-like family protein [Chloroflexota bacterium]
MIKLKSKNKYERGQVLPFVVILLTVIIGTVALMLDGGSIMSNRRSAQAAADTGALAGAQRACLGFNDASVYAEQYATGNGATSVNVSIAGTQVTVTATIEYGSFFSKIFGYQTLNTNATATAGCYMPDGRSVVPLAWNCRAPTVGGGPYDPDMGCQIQTLSWDTFEPLVTGQISSVTHDSKVYFMDGADIVDSSHVPPKQIYIIIDSDKICLEDDPLNGVIPCDLDGDGKKEIQLGGDRGWLYLTADTSNIGSWIGANGPHPDFNLDSHVWLSGKSGNVVAVYNEMINSGFIGQTVLIPVYNEICDGDPRTDATCVANAHASPPWPSFNGVDDFSEIRNTSLNYHIITFEPFYISCVDTKGDCPGFQHAQTLPGGDELKDIPVIEGYFLRDFELSPDVTQSCILNLGNCIITLSN